MQNSLRRRLNRSFIGLSLIPLLLVGLILTTLAYVVEERQARTQETLVVQRVSQEVLSFFTEVEGELQLLIRFGLMDISPSRQETLLLNLLSYHDHFDELILLNGVGETQVRVTRLNVIARNESVNYAAADEFLTPYFTHHTYFSPITFAENTGEPLLNLGVPIIDPRDGQLSGVLVAHTRLKQVWELIAAIPLRSGESVYMVDDRGRVVAHRNPSVVLRGTQFTLPADDGLAEGLDSSWVILVEQVLEVPGQNLIVVAERNVLDALTLPILTGSITAGLFLITWLVATARGVRTVTHIVQPIQDLVETTHAIRAGDLTRRASVTQQDEVGELAAAFNDMAEQLRHTLDGLQEKITELEQISQALRESETRYRSIFENAQEGIYRASKQGAFLMVNPALVTILGYESEAELLQLDLARDVYLVPEDRAKLLRQLDQKGQITNMEINWKRKDGTIITVSLYTHPLYDAQYQIIGYEGLVFDISQRRKMEQERERLIQELEAKNAELERFTYTVSHDLKSPSLPFALIWAC